MAYQLIDVVACRRLKGKRRVPVIPIEYHETWLALEHLLTFIGTAYDQYTVPDAKTPYRRDEAFDILHIIAVDEGDEDW